MTSCTRAFDRYFAGDDDWRVNPFCALALVGVVILYAAVWFVWPSGEPRGPRGNVAW